MQAFSKLHKNLDGNMRYTPCWQTASFTDVFAASVTSLNVSLYDVEGADILFRNERSRRANQQFRNHTFTKCDEASALSVNWLDTSMTSIIGSFQLSSSDCETTPDNQESNKECNLSGTKRNRIARGGTIPLDSACRLKALLSHAAALSTVSFWMTFPT